MKKRINVVHLVEHLPVGGLERTLVSIVLNLDKEKYNVSVWCLKEGGGFADKLLREGADVRILHIFTSRNPLNIFRLYRLLRKHKIDLIHTHAYSAGTIGRISAFLARVPIIISHNQSVYDYYNKYFNFVEWVLSSITDRIICCSDAVKKFTTEVQRIDAGRLMTVYNGAEDFPPVSETATSRIREELDIPVDHSVICTIAQLNDKKGHAYFIRSAFMLLKSRKRVSFLLVGDGILREGLKKLCVELDIEKNVIFAGERSDIPEMLSLTDIFVLPSVREGLGLSILEAMVCGKPVIATNVEGIPEIVKDGINGILVPPKDTEALCGAMKELLDDGAKREQMGSKGREMCGKDFSSRVMVGKIEELYDTLVKKKC